MRKSPHPHPGPRRQGGTRPGGFAEGDEPPTPVAFALCPRPGGGDDPCGDIRWEPPGADEAHASPSHAMPGTAAARPSCPRTASHWPDPRRGDSSPPRPAAGGRHGLLGPWLGRAPPTPPSSGRHEPHLLPPCRAGSTLSPRVSGGTTGDSPWAKSRTWVQFPIYL